MSEEFESKKCDECHQNKQETVDLDLPDGTHTVVCRECVEVIVEQFQAEEAMMPQPEQWQPECCICKTNENVEWVGGYQAYRCNSKDCIPL